MDKLLIKLRPIRTVTNLMLTIYTAQKMKFSIKDFFCKCDQIRSFLRIWSHLLKKSLMKNFIFCTMVFLKFSGTYCRRKQIYIGYMKHLNMETKKIGEALKKLKIFFKTRASFVDQRYMCIEIL